MNIFLALLFATISASTFAQNLPLPSRSTNALDGDAFGRAILTLDLGARNKAIADEFLAGNVPDFLRTFCPVTVTNVSDGVTNVGTFFVAPDYLAIGADTNYLFAPVSPDTAQRIADRLACTLPTRKMVDAIDAAATVKLEPSPIPPSAAMTSVAVFIQYNQTVWAQRMALTNRCPPGVLVAGDKKDLVLTRRLARATNNVAIYGWHHTNGAPVQPLFCGHAWWWVDYSQGVRLVSRMMLVNGAEKSVADVLADPNFCGLISDEGVITNARYATNFAWPDKISLPWPEITTLDGVRIFVDAPASALESFSANQPVELVFYALPNGNTIEETIGKKLAQGDDWHFDIQHIGAQTQWLRNVITNKAIVVAYLEANTKSWPAWRRTHFDSDRRIAQIVDEVSAIFPSNRTEVVLASHSGGGSCVFGYLNAMDEIPAKVSRIAFLDSDYAYDSKLHAKKIINWLAASADHRLCVLAYQDYLGLLNGKPFVSEAGGTWGRSRAMLADLAKQFSFGSETNTGLEIYSTKDRQVEFLLKENPEHKILHTVQVERNGFIQAMLSGTDWEGRGYEYLGARVYGER
ncbi:MAG TPA: hypothetical protein VGY98_12280 [Verrucomicrobiae bacterium]|nr:hypothetical protein [Verrucomicrobiae bacterium]